MKIATSSFSHITYNLKLRRWTLFQDSCFESEFNISRCLSSVDKRIGTKELFIPLSNKSFEAEVTEHGHMSSIQDHFKKSKDCLLSFTETMSRISTATLPVKDNTIRMNLSQVLYQIFHFFIALFLSHSVIYMTYCFCTTAIHKNLCTFHSLLFYCSEKLVV